MLAPVVGMAQRLLLCRPELERLLRHRHDLADGGVGDEAGADGWSLCEGMYVCKGRENCMFLNAPRAVAGVARGAHADPEGHALSVEEGVGVLCC